MKPKTKEYLCEFFSGICFWVGFSIHGSGDLCFLIAGCVGAGFSLRYHLQNSKTHGITDRTANGWGMLAFLVCAVGCFLYWRENKQPEPTPSPKPSAHFRLELLTVDPSGKTPVVLDMTNKCLIEKGSGPFFDKTVGVLNIPIAPDLALKYTNITCFLNFDVFNASAVDGKYSELSFGWLMSAIRVRLTDGWQGEMPPPGYTDSLLFTPPSDFTLLHFDAKPIPPLKFDGIDLHASNAQYGQASISLKQPGLSDVMFAFIIHFVSDTNMSAYITEFTNPLGTNFGVATVPFPSRP